MGWQSYVLYYSNDDQKREILQTIKNHNEYGKTCDMEDYAVSADILVVGGGVSGIAAAVEAAQSPAPGRLGLADSVSLAAAAPRVPARGKSQPFDGAG